MKRVLLLSIAILLNFMTTAQQLEITRVKHSGPFIIPAPFMADSTDVNFKEWNAKSLLDLPLSANALKNAQYKEISAITENTGEETANSINILGFTLQNSRYAKTTINIEGIEDYHIYHNGKRIQGQELVLEPATHDIVVKYLTEKTAC